MLVKFMNAEAPQKIAINPDHVRVIREEDQYVTAIVVFIAGDFAEHLKVEGSFDEVLQKFEATMTVNGATEAQTGSGIKGSRR